MGEYLSHSISNFSVNLLLRPCEEVVFEPVEKDNPNDPNPGWTYTGCRNQVKQGVDTGYEADDELHPVCSKVGKNYPAPKRPDGSKRYGGRGRCYQREKGNLGTPVVAIPNADE